MARIGDSSLRLGKPGLDKRPVARWAGRRGELAETLREAIDEPSSDGEMRGGKGAA